MTERRAGSPWPDEHAVADELSIECPPEIAARVLESVPFWFHTFSLNRSAALYAEGVARDHGYRLGSIPRSFAGKSVLDVGTFDGFYAFLAEKRGASRVLAVDNEQYRAWVKDRWGTELRGGEGFRAIADLLGSDAEYRRMDAFDLDSLEERFDFIFCQGILHRVHNPFGLLKVLTDRLAEAGQLLIETAGVPGDDGAAEGAIRVPHPGQVNARDDYFYWQFSSGSVQHLAEFLDGCEFALQAMPVVDGQTRLIGHINKAARIGHGGATRRPSFTRR